MAKTDKTTRKEPARESARVRNWFERLRSGTKLHADWEDKYRVKTCEAYVEGFHWSGTPEDQAKKQYVINLILGSIETSKPAMLFTRPQVKVIPRPGHDDDFDSQASDRAKLQQDAIQTIIDDPRVAFDSYAEAGLDDAFSRFGVIEVGYSADWIDNPNAEKPLLKENTDEPLTDGEGKTVPQPAKILAEGTKERIFVKQIPADQCRVSVSSRRRLEENDWFGYFEWQYVEDIKANDQYNTDGLKAGGVIDDKYRDSLDTANDQKPDMVKVWKIWDLRTGKKHVLAEGFEHFLKEGEAAPFFPIAVLRFIERKKDFYPLPAILNWLSPQDEVNETREMQKAHRKRFTRRYTYKDGDIDQAELDKLETGGDGVYAKHNANVPSGASPLTPVPDAPLSASVDRDLAYAKEDFMQVSGVSGDQRGVPEGTTATQANIVHTYSQLRESKNRMKVAIWLGQIARLILLTCKEYMDAPFWIKQSVDPFAPGMEETIRVTELWKQIKAEDLGDVDFDISVDLASLSPVTEDMQRAQWNQVIALVSNPAVAFLLSASPILLRKTLALYGIRSENEIREIQKVLQATMAQMQQMAQAKAGMPGVTPTASVPSLLGAPQMPALPAGVVQ